MTTFVLSGGGNLGAVQVGMLSALVEAGIRPSMIVGTSVGAINGAFLASPSSVQGVAEIADFWVTLRRDHLLELRMRSLARGVWGRSYFFDSKPMRRVVEFFLAFERLERSPIPVAVVATALSTGEAVVLDSGDATTALLASTAIPRVLPPVDIGGRLLVDGAAAADVPLRQALSLDMGEMYVFPTAPAQVVRMWGSLSPSELSDVGHTRTIHVLRPPQVHVPLGDLRQTPRLLDLGYRHARMWLAGRLPQ